jgi:hypothetical protein
MVLVTLRQRSQPESTIFLGPEPCNFFGSNILKTKSILEPQRTLQIKIWFCKKQLNKQSSDLNKLQSRSFFTIPRPAGHGWRAKCCRPSTEAVFWGYSSHAKQIRPKRLTDFGHVFLKYQQYTGFWWCTSILNHT